MKVNGVTSDTTGVKQSVESGQPASTDDKPKEKIRVWTQVLACVGAAIGQGAVGAVSGWSGGSLPSLQNDPDINPTTAQTAWIVSIMALGAMLGGAMAGRLMDAVGRRTTLLLAAPVLMAGWALMGLAPNVPIIILGRFVAGLSTGFILASSQVFTSESCESRLRGKMSSLPTLFFTSGTLTAYTGGALLSWRYNCIVCAASCIPMILILIVVPETPYWLLLKRQRSKSEAALRWLRGSQCDLEPLLRTMEDKLDSVGPKLAMRELWHPRTRTPLLMALFLQAAQQLCGGTLLFFYTSTVYMTMGHSKSNLAAVYTGIAQLTASGISLLLVDRVGRRPLMITSTAIVGTILIGMGFYQHSRMMGGASIDWLPILLVLLTVSGYCLGCRSVPLILSSELFNTTARSTAQASCTLFNRGLNMAVMQIFPFFLAGAGLSTVFFVHGCIGLLSSFVTFLWIPETKNKTLEEIQEYFEDCAANNNSGTPSSSLGSFFSKFTLTNTEKNNQQSQSSQPEVPLKTTSHVYVKEGVSNSIVINDDLP
ncbi:hypothetical protein Pcinc_029999 [Petrolisthes cinctipes]|uniref:Major facilitator superfamily (MFS) profile domain-containing protein n=1 Tax=Petrolisthes cinctipes TaxID=88211 RepID=A0AAE1F071_PETCI|nr:hypothetical protein Pcinc_029999 [Petrolisthes cinctipes]